jgi:hypothetical protein
MWLAQSLEISLLRLPGALGSFHLPPVLIVYLALTRSWGVLTLLAFVFSYLGSTSVSHSTAVYIAAQVWTALATKGVATALALEGRPQFTMLVAGSHIMSRILTHLLLVYIGQGADFWTFLSYTVLGTLPAALLGWLLFPLFMEWDRYFGHEADESRELNPDLIR